MENKNFTFFHRDSNGLRKEFNLRKCHATMSRLAMIFKLEPISVFLTEEFHGPAEFPENDGTFNVLNDAMDETSFRVHGVEQGRNSSNRPPVEEAPQLGAFRRFQLNSASRSGPAAKRVVHFLKITLATYRHGKIDLHLRQKVLTITDQNANVDALTIKVREAFEDENLILVQANGLRFEPSEATSELQYWKISSRKVFAIPEREFHQNMPSSSSRPTTSKKRKSNIDTDELADLFEERLAKLESLNVSPSTTSTSTSNSTAAINAFNDAVNDAFHCVICADLSKPPVSLSSCCMRIVGCAACVERWHVNHANCPHCGVNDCTITSLHCFTTMLEKLVALREREL